MNYFCSSVNDVSNWRQMFNFFFPFRNCWYQLNSRKVKTHSARIRTWNNWGTIAETRNRLFRERCHYRGHRTRLGSKCFTNFRPFCYDLNGNHNVRQTKLLYPPYRIQVAPVEKQWKPSHVLTSIWRGRGKINRDLLAFGGILITRLGSCEKIRLNLSIILHSATEDRSSWKYLYRVKRNTNQTKYNLIPSTRKNNN